MMLLSSYVLLSVLKTFVKVVKFCKLVLSFRSPRRSEQPFPDVLNTNGLMFSTIALVSFCEFDKLLSLITDGALKLLE
jgi:hypothetical protein